MLSDHAVKVIMVTARDTRLEMPQAGNDSTSEMRLSTSV
jgi:hypothetical protein